MLLFLEALEEGEHSLNPLPPPPLPLLKQDAAEF